jgi:hypothetical protein
VDTYPYGKTRDPIRSLNTLYADFRAGHVIYSPALSRRFLRDFEACLFACFVEFSGLMLDSDEVQVTFNTYMKEFQGRMNSHQAIDFLAKKFNTNVKVYDSEFQTVKYSFYHEEEFEIASVADIVISSEWLSRQFTEGAFLPISTETIGTRNIVRAKQNFGLLLLVNDSNHWRYAERIQLEECSGCNMMFSSLSIPKHQEVCVKFGKRQKCAQCLRFYRGDMTIHTCSKNVKSFVDTKIIKKSFR